MKTAAIIAEYNPFHNGHAHQIQILKKDLGFDHVIAVMSPDFVQRGEPAITDMYDRAKAALLGGADVCLALPVCLATGSAEYFAQGAVLILHSLGCVDALCFGCESPDLAFLKKAAAALNKEAPLFRETLRREMSTGISFPAAREKALLASMQEAASFAASASGRSALHDLLSSPNNILGLEYVRTLLRLRSDIMPLPIRRTGSAFHDLTLTDEDSTRPCPSAAALRVLIKNMALQEYPPAESAYISSLRPFIPALPLQVLTTALLSERTPLQDRYDLLMRYALLAFSRDPDPGIQDMGSDLSRRIIANLDQYKKAESFAGRLHSKNFTHSRVNRALLHVLLGIPQAMPDALLGKPAISDHPVYLKCSETQQKEEEQKKEEAQQNQPAHQKTDPPEAMLYTQLIGFQKDASALLGEIKKKSSIPIITRPASARSLLKGMSLSSFEMDMHAQDVYGLLCGSSCEIHAGYRRSPVILNS